MSQDFHNVLFCIENPLLDISADVSVDMLKKYDAHFGNSVLANEKQLPVFEELTNNYKVEYSAGGATQNVARVFQWMLQKGPNCASYTGCVGEDAYAEALRQAAKRDGVNVNYVVDQTTPTGTCACLIVGKERSLIANLGAANNFKLEHLHSAENQALMKSARYYYSSGFFLTVCPPAQLEVAQHAAENNKVFMTNLAAVFITQFFLDPLKKVLPYCDYVFGNEEEARTFSKAMGWETESIPEIAKKLAAMEKVNTKRPRTVIFTQGALPVIVAIQGEEGVHEFEVPHLPNDELIDTNGAGDSFCGGFLSRLVQDKPLAQCVKAGIYASGVVIRRSGCTFPEKPTYHDE